MAKIEKDPHPCPEPPTIVKYALNDIQDPFIEGAVAEHLKICPGCRIEVEALKGALEETFVRRK